MTNHLIKTLYACIAAVAGLMFGSTASAQSYPSRPVTLIMPLPAGSATETHIRLLANEAGKYLAQPVVVENRPGAGGRIGMRAIMAEKPDGQTIGMTFNGIAVVLALGDASFRIEPGKDYTPVILASQAPLVMVTGPTAPFRDIQGLVAYARTNPGKLTISGSSLGSSAHLGFELLKLMTGIDFVLVNFQGEILSTPALLNGDVQAMIASASIKPYLDTGKLVAMGTTGSQRWSLLPGLPTIQESGLPGFDIASWYGIVAPPSLPPTVLARLNEAFGAALASSAVRKAFGDLGINPVGSTPDEFARRIRADLERMAPVIRKAGLKFD